MVCQIETSVLVDCVNQFSAVVEDQIKIMASFTKQLSTTSTLSVK